MSFFRSEDDVDDWCRRTGEAKGDILSLEQAWRLAIAWFGDRMQPAYRNLSDEDMRRLFLNLGLTSAFWQS